MGKEQRFPGVGLGQLSWGSHQHNSRENIPGKIKNLELACVFVLDMCSTSTYFPGETFFLVNKSHLKHCENRRYTAMLRNW